MPCYFPQDGDASVWECDGETHNHEPSRVKHHHPAWSRNSAIPLQLCLLPSKRVQIKQTSDEISSSKFSFAQQRLAVARPSDEAPFVLSFSKTMSLGTTFRPYHPGFRPSRATRASKLVRVMADRRIITANRFNVFARAVTVAMLVSLDSFIPRHAPCSVLLVRAHM